MKDRSANFIVNAEVPWEVTGVGVSRQILGYDEQVMLVKVKFEKGSVGYVHKHFHSQVTYVASGVFKVMINGEEIIGL